MVITNLSNSNAVCASLATSKCQKCLQYRLCLSCLICKEVLEFDRRRRPTDRPTDRSIYRSIRFKWIRLLSLYARSLVSERPGDLVLQSMQWLNIVWGFVKFCLTKACNISLSLGNGTTGRKWEWVNSLKSNRSINRSIGRSTAGGRSVGGGRSV